mmetsp:Transcript_14995/g.35291  ORF Transcript_14995/g.35291 Transcript_14995/m.35291 type:complete len:362 (-) Transcript_14995:998-2083(-)
MLGATRRVTTTAARCSSSRPPDGAETKSTPLDVTSSLRRPGSSAGVSQVRSQGLTQVAASTRSPPRRQASAPETSGKLAPATETTWPPVSGTALGLTDDTVSSESNQKTGARASCEKSAPPLLLTDTETPAGPPSKCHPGERRGGATTVRASLVAWDGATKTGGCWDPTGRKATRRLGEGSKSRPVTVSAVPPCALPLLGETPSADGSRAYRKVRFWSLGPGTATAASVKGARSATLTATRPPAASRPPKASPRCTTPKVSASGLCRLKGGARHSTAEPLTARASTSTSPKRQTGTSPADPADPPATRDGTRESKPVASMVTSVPPPSPPDAGARPRTFLVVPKRTVSGGAATPDSSKAAP